MLKREMMKMRRMRRWPRGVYLEEEEEEVREGKSKMNSKEKN